MASSVYLFVITEMITLLKLIPTVEILFTSQIFCEIRKYYSSQKLLKKMQTILAKYSKMN